MKPLYALATAVLLFNAAAFAADAPGRPERSEPAKTRVEAIAKAEHYLKRAEQRLADLKAMTDDQWNKKHAEQQKQREERHEKRKAHRATMDKTAPAAGAKEKAPAIK